MSDTARKPLPPALKALKPILDALHHEEDEEGGEETANVKDFTVRAPPDASYRVRAED